MNKVATDILMRISKNLCEESKSAFEAARKTTSREQRIMLKGKIKAYNQTIYFIRDTYGYAAEFPIPLKHDE